MQSLLASAFASTGVVVLHLKRRLMFASAVIGVHEKLLVFQFCVNGFRCLRREDFEFLRGGNEYKNEE